MERRPNVGANVEGSLGLRTKQYCPLDVHEVDTVVGAGGGMVGERVSHANHICGIHALSVSSIESQRTDMASSVRVGWYSFQ